MICFTAFNDRGIYRGFTLGENDAIGLKFDFCSIIEPGYPTKPPVITSPENRLYFSVNRAEVKTKGLILRASLATTLSDPEPVIVDGDNSEENTYTSLIHWIITNHSPHFGPIKLSDSLKQSKVYLHKYTEGFWEVLFSLKDGHLTDVVFSNDQKLTLSFADRKLNFVNNRQPPEPLTLQDPPSKPA